MTNWQEKARKRMKLLGITQQELCAPLGVTTRSAVGHYFNDRRKLSSDQAVALAMALNMTMQELFSDSESVVSTSLKPVSIIAGNDYDVPVLNVELSAGFGSFNDSEAVLETIPVPERILEEMGVPPSSARIVSIRGDSMEGTLRDREKVVVNTSETRLVSNKIYAFEFDGELKVKRFIKQFDSNWTISSDNKHDPAYQDQTVAPHNIDQLRIIGRVAGLLARTL